MQIENLLTTHQHKCQDIFTMEPIVSLPFGVVVYHVQIMVWQGAQKNSIS
jgi:hypothetical protein